MFAYMGVCAVHYTHCATRCSNKMISITLHHGTFAFSHLLPCNALQCPTNPSQQGTSCLCALQAAPSQGLPALVQGTLAAARWDVDCAVARGLEAAFPQHAGQTGAEVCSGGSTG